MSCLLMCSLGYWAGLLVSTLHLRLVLRSSNHLCHYSQTWEAVAHAAVVVAEEVGAEENQADQEWVAGHGLVL